MRGTECFDKIVLGRKDRRSHHQHRENFAAGIASPEQHVTKQSVSAGFIVDRDFERPEELSEGMHDLLAGPVLQKTVIRVNHAVSAAFIAAGKDIALTVPGKGMVHFVPIVQRILHREYRQDFTIAAEERLKIEGLLDGNGDPVQPEGPIAADEEAPKSPASTDIDPVRDILPLKMVLEVFGGAQKLVGTDKDPEAQYLKLKEAGADIPKLYLAIGKDDSLLEVNREFAAFLEKEGADYTYEEGPGKHDWFFWNEYVERGLKCVLG